jgi:hypothetical protein
MEPVDVWAGGGLRHGDLGKIGAVILSSPWWLGMAIIGFSGVPVQVEVLGFVLIPQCIESLVPSGNGGWVDDAFMAGGGGSPVVGVASGVR